MSASIDWRIRELGSLRLVLREDLIVSPGVATGPDTYSIEDPLTSKFYFVGRREYDFVSLLDGRQSVGEVLHRAATQDSNTSLTEREAAVLCRWLVDRQLVRTIGKANHASEGTNRSSPQAPLPTRLNPLSFKLSLIDPDRWLSHLEHGVGCLFGWRAFAGWSLAVFGAIVMVLSQTDRLRQSSAGVLSTDNWAWLGLSWMALKIIHEMAHAITCKRYGGSVHDAGLLFVLLTPVAYVDLTSAWRFRSKWQRIHTAAAGMYAEIFAASVATWAWTYTTPGLLQHVAFNTMLMASVTTVAFNINPLLRFDGYYILADWVEIPNLASQASLLWRGWMRRLCLGLPRTSSQLQPVQRHFVALYGLASLAWRGLVTISLLLAASVMFHGAGIVLAAAAIVLMWLVPALKGVSSVWDARQGRPNWVRFALMTSLAFAGVVSLFTVIPWFGPYRAPAVVEFSSLEIVRAECSGFVSDLPVRPGDRVRAGELLVVIDNPELMQQLREVELDIECRELKARRLKREGKLAEYQAEQEKLASLEVQLVEKKAEVAGLSIHAGREGVVMGRRLATLTGNYLAKGDEILAIGEEDKKEMRVSVAQHDVQWFNERIGTPIRIHMGSGESFSGPFAKLEPSASTLPPHPALGANTGGPIPVTERRQQNGKKQETIRHEFLAPRFVGVVPLDASAATKLFSGQSGEISFRSYTESFGQHVIVLARRWLKAKLELLTN